MDEQYNKYLKFIDNDSQYKNALHILYSKTNKCLSCKKNKLIKNINNGFINCSECNWTIKIDKVNYINLFNQLYQNIYNKEKILYDLIYSNNINEYKKKFLDINNEIIEINKIFNIQNDELKEILNINKNLLKQLLTLYYKRKEIFEKIDKSLTNRKQLILIYKNEGIKLSNTRIKEISKDFNIKDDMIKYYLFWLDLCNSYIKIKNELMENIIKKKNFLNKIQIINNNFLIQLPIIIENKEILFSQNILHKGGNINTDTNEEIANNLEEKKNININKYKKSIYNNLSNNINSNIDNTIVNPSTNNNANTIANPTINNNANNIVNPSINNTNYANTIVNPNTNNNANTNTIVNPNTNNNANTIVNPSINNTNNNANTIVNPSINNTNNNANTIVNPNTNNNANTIVNPSINNNNANTIVNPSINNTNNNADTIVNPNTNNNANNNTNNNADTIVNPNSDMNIVTSNTAIINPNSDINSNDNMNIDLNTKTIQIPIENFISTNINDIK